MAEIKDGGKVFHRGKMVGKILNNRYLTPRKEEHFYKKLQSFGIAKDIIELLKEREVLLIHFQYHNKEGRTTYKVSIEKFMDEGMEVHEKGYEKQIHLPLKDMYESQSNGVQKQMKSFDNPKEMKDDL